MPPLHFAFGASGSAFPTGYTPVAATGYSQSAGFGWAPGSTIYADDAYQPDSTPDEYGINYGVNDTFLVDLPNGTYTVTPSLNDPFRALDHVSISAQGQVLASGLSAAAGQTIATAYNVNVTNGQLALNIADNNGTNPYFAIHSLDIEPVAAPATTTTTSKSFTFGTTSSPVPTGSTGVASSIYTQTLGYGWASGSVVYSDSAYSATSSPNEIGFNYGVNATFLVDLPNGTYNVTPTLDDPFRALDSIALAAQGTTLATGLGAAAGQAITSTYQVTVSNGQLALNIADVNGSNPYFAITQLIVAPAAGSTTTGSGTGSTGGTSTPPAGSGSGSGGGTSSSGNSVAITSAWLAAQGSAPYVLSQANTTYTLETNVTATGTAFVVAAPNVTLDLNGYTVTYGNATPVVVQNGGFEQGTGRKVQGWNLSGASNAAIASNTTNLYGNQVLRFSNLTSSSATQTIVSAPISIPEANHTYAASVSMSAPGGTQNSPIGTVIIQVYQVSNNALLATGTVGGGYNADGSIASFTPKTTAQVYLKILVAASTSSKTTLDIDDVQLTPSYDYGVVASNEWNFNGYANLPAAVQWGGAQGYNNAGAFTVTSSLPGGTISEGPGHGYGSHAIMAESLQAPLVVNGLTINVGGIDTSAIYALNNAAAATTETHTITNNTINDSAGMDVIRRASDIAQIDLNRAGGNTIVSGNTITGIPQIGIMITGDPATQSQTTHLIQNNKLVGDNVVTNGYLMSAYAISNLKILNNTLTAGVGQSGEGIDLDSQTHANSSNIDIEGNVVNVREAATREYGASVPGRAFRIRNDAGGSNAGSFNNLSVVGNTFIAMADATSTLAAYGVWVTLVNNSGATAPNSGISFTNNTIQAIDGTTNPNASAKALVIDGIDAGIKPTFTGNTIGSNDISLALTDYDAGNVSDVTLVDNTLSKLSAGAALPYIGIRAGYWTNAIHNVAIINTQVENGATTAITWAGSGTKDIEVGTTVNIVAQTAAGAAISGATVNITDGQGTSVYSGTTGSGGDSQGIAVVATTYTQPGTDPTQITTTNFNAFTVSVTVGGVTQKQVVQLDTDPTLVFTFATS